METPILEKQKKKQYIEPPKKWNVVFHNDDFTTFGFVVYLLVNVFKKNDSESIALAQKIHDEKKAVVATYNKEIAQTKQVIAMETAVINNFPLQVTIEEM